MNIEDEAWEYYECIVIAELAMYMARAHGEYESKAIDDTTINSLVSYDFT